MFMPFIADLERGYQELTRLSQRLALRLAILAEQKAAKTIQLQTIAIKRPELWRGRQIRRRQ